MGVEGFKEFPSIDLLFMVQILIESTTGQVVRHRKCGSHSRAQNRAAAFGVVHFWPSHSTSGSSYCSCFILGFGSGIVAIFVWLLYISECCNTDTVGSILHN